MYSMTGFGKADVKTKNLSISVEINSVNSRYLEYHLRLPKQLFFLEPKLKELIGKQLSRGKIMMSVNYTDLGLGIDRLSVNKPLADELNRQLLSLKKKYKLSGEVDINHFLQFPDIFKMAKDPDLEAKVWPQLNKAVKKALEDILRMRRREGANLKKDLMSRLKLLSDRIGKVEKLAPENVSEYRDKLKRRVEDVMSDGMINGKRLEEEVAYHAEKADITEETIRFQSHIKQFRQALQNDKPIGKRLNFILQEFNREANTIGSKAGNSKIASIVLELKEEIEKMREQVQNIE